MEETITNKNSITTNNGENKTFFGDSFNIAKQNESKGTNILQSIKENEEKKIEIDKLCEQLKNTKIILAHKIQLKVAEFEKIDIEGKNFDDFKQIGGNDLRKCDMIENFISFGKDVKEKIDVFLDNYEMKYNFKIEMEMKENKSYGDYDLDCYYKLIISDDSKKIYSAEYKDKTILINKTSEGFQYLIDDLKRYIATK